LDTIPETQDLDIDLEVVLPNVSIGVGHLPYEEIVDPNATTLPMHSTPGIDSPISPVIGVQTADAKYISPVFGIPPQTTSGWDRTHNPILYNSIKLYYELSIYSCRPIM